MTKEYIRKHFQNKDIKLTDEKLDELKDKLDGMESIFEQITILTNLEMAIKAVENRKRNKLKNKPDPIQEEDISFDTLFPTIKKKKTPYPFTWNQKSGSEIPKMSLKNGAF